jgi:hypothetical protein
MNTILIVIGLFFGLSMLSSILVLSACVLSSRTSRRFECLAPESDTDPELGSHYEPGLAKETVRA